MTPDWMDLAGQLVEHPRWTLVEGMLLCTHDGTPLGRWPLGQGPAGALPVLDDFPTGGALLGVLDDLGVLVDVARESEGFIVAVETGEGLRGWIDDTLAAAAGWALLATWDDEPEE